MTTTNELLETFIAAQRLWEHCEDGEESGRLIRRGEDALQSLQALNGSVKPYLMTLLKHPDDVVRGAAASYLIHLDPEPAIAELQRLAEEGRGSVRIDAEGVLLAREHGSLRPPFPLK